ncbi:MAG: hypothetical protein WBZ15_18205 [Mycobacterium sp.]|jgi:hypothetical protein|uniref:hypothetical protein n=1 Tax=Mycobacterium sp. TaxID=1785 RepID=UPI0028B683B9|nr:hypothetical protein [Mycobacterium sp.]
MRMHITYKSLKLTAGALMVALAVFGLTGCGGGGAKTTPERLGLMPGTSSAQFEVGSTLQ